MVTWILGRSGTGKTTLLLNKLPALAGEYEQVYFLVPEQSSMMLEREISRRKTQGVQVPAAEQCYFPAVRRHCRLLFVANQGNGADLPDPAGAAGRLALLCQSAADDGICKPPGRGVF